MPRPTRRHVAQTHDSAAFFCTSLHLLVRAIVTMAAPKVFVLIFVVIFVSFICLLVWLRQSRGVKPVYEDDDDNSNVTDSLVDLSKLYRATCPSCPARSLRDHVCDPKSFVVICSVTRLSGKSGPADRVYTVRLISQLKHFPDVTSSSIMSDSSIITRATDDTCDVNLIPGQEYVLTGRIDSRGLASVSTCDVAINWNLMPRPKQLSFFAYFSPFLRC